MVAIEPVVSERTLIVETKNNFKLQVKIFCGKTTIWDTHASSQNQFLKNFSVLKIPPDDGNPTGIS